MNITLQYVRENNVVYDLVKLRKCISAAENLEEDEANQTKMDKKTLYRLLFHMQRQKHIKIFRVTLKLNGKHKTIILITMPHITTDNEVIQAEIERTKNYFFVAKQQDVLNKDDDTNLCLVDYYKDACVMKIDDQIKYMKNIYNRRCAKQYGYRARFVRLRIMHQFLYYLIHELNEENSPGMQKFYN